MGRANNRAVAAMSGIFVVDKPTGMSSMAAVSVVRARAGGVKTGHAGTLDPLASGVLVMALGRATKHLARFMAADKLYRTVVDLSAFTSTDDLEGERREVEAARPPGEAEIRSALGQFVGRILQRPPAFSAVKVSGRPAYKLAAKGKAPELSPRTVHVYWLHVHHFAWPELDFEVCCGRGTYVRALIRDWGAALGAGGCLTSLTRSVIGRLALDEAVTFTDLARDPLERLLSPLESAKAWLAERPISIPPRP